jgi:hypothetical protein
MTQFRSTDDDQFLRQLRLRPRGGGLVGDLMKPKEFSSNRPGGHYFLCQICDFFVVKSWIFALKSL